MPLDPPTAHPSGKLSCPQTALGPVLVGVKFQPSSTFRDMRGSRFAVRGAAPPHAPRGGNFHALKEYLELSICL